MSMATQRHVMQLQLLMDPLRVLWEGRQDVYLGGNMLVYFNREQVRHKDFHQPDFFVALDVSKRERQSWVVWEEGKGPDVVIELLSNSTTEQEKRERQDIYQNCLCVPEYFWFDPFSAAWAGFILQHGRYEAIPEDSQGRLVSQTLGLVLARWQGIYHAVEARWLRWATLAGTLLPTPQEVAAEAQHYAAEAQRHTVEAQRQAMDAQRYAAEAQRQAAEAQSEKQALEALLSRYRELFGDISDVDR
jgi:Uma2 family endonuclease